MFTYANSGEQLWLIGSFNGSIESDLALDIPLTWAKGTRFQSFNSVHVKVVPWDMARITFNDCLRATAVIEGLSGQ